MRTVWGQPRDESTQSYSFGQAYWLDRGLTALRSQHTISTVVRQHVKTKHLENHHEKAGRAGCRASGGRRPQLGRGRTDGFGPGRGHLRRAESGEPGGVHPGRAGGAVSGAAVEGDSAPLASRDRAVTTDSRSAITVYEGKPTDEPGPPARCGCAEGSSPERLR